MRLARVTVATSGIVLRDDPDFGLLAFSPYTGLIYAVHRVDALRVARWLKKRGPAPSEVYSHTLGAGWAVSFDEARYPAPRLLPNSHAWPQLPQLRRPILVNWFLTGRCPLACLYCYAEDLMRNEQLEPDLHKLAQIAKAILSLHPLVVVLTGGDPLFSPLLPQALALLHGRVGIVLDTSGYTLRTEHISLFRSHGVTVRVSIDSERPRVHEAQRPLSDLYPGFKRSGRGTLDAALETLSACLQAGVPVAVQTVATKKTVNDLLPLGDKLYRLGVRSWRIFKVAPSEARMAGYRLLVGTHSDTGKRLTRHNPSKSYRYNFERVLESRSRHWNGTMDVQVTHNEIPNSVILVSPDGVFMTQSNTIVQKLVIDSDHPRSPRLASLRRAVDMSGHAKRYLNLTTPLDDTSPGPR